MKINLQNVDKEKVKTGLVGTFFGTLFLILVVISISIFCFKVPKIMASTGCGQISEGTPFYKMKPGKYTDINTNESVILKDGVASISVFGVEFTQMIAPKCHTSDPDYEIVGKLSLRGEDGVNHIIESGIKLITENKSEASSNNLVSFEMKPSGEYCSNPKLSPYCGIIEDAGKMHGIDPKLIAAVILQESGGQPEVISSSGAVGLMQVMPRDGKASTFICGNEPCFPNRPTISELKDPEFNVNFGARMLAGLVNSNGLRHGLRSYGPMDVGYYYADLVIGIYNELKA